MIYQFGQFSLDTGSLELRKGEAPVLVEPQVFSVLVYLIQNRDRVVGKDELIETVWNGRAVSDSTLNSRINSARRAVDDTGSAQAIIRTFARRGFRFVAVVTETEADPIELEGRLASSDEPSIAVMPFVNLSNDPQQEFVADGIAGDLILALSRVRNFRVVARGSTFSYKGRSIDIRQVAGELDVRYVIEGSVQMVGDRIRLSVQLVDGEAGKQIWSEKYDRNLSDIFSLQDELSIAIVGSVEPELGRSEQERAMRKRPDSLDAWEAYQRGMSSLYRHTADDVDEAQRYFRKAVDIDPRFAPGYAAIARAYFWNTILGMAENDREEAEKAARRAIELSPDDARAYYSMGSVHFTNSEFERAIPVLETAIELNPSFAAARHMLGTVLVHSGKPEEALPHIERAIQLSPKDSEIALFHARRALVHLYLHQHEEAVDWARKAVRMPHVQWPAYCFVVSGLAHLGRMEEAEDALADLVEFRPGTTARFIQDHFPGASGVHFDHLLDGLLKAGLPE